MADFQDMRLKHKATLPKLRHGATSADQYQRDVEMRDAIKRVEQAARYVGARRDEVKALLRVLDLDSTSS
jgi:hypothetical protein